jgi:hypothetical protein
MEVCEVVATVGAWSVSSGAPRSGAVAAPQGPVVDLAAFERVRDAALGAATAAADVRATVQDFVAEHRDGPLLRRVRESLALDVLRSPDDLAVRGAESLVAAAIATLDPTSLTR